MGPTIIARNYAETLLALARSNGGDAAMDAYGVALHDVVQLLRGEPRLQQFLETPRVTAEERKRVIRASFQGRVPDPFLRFLMVLIDKRRQALLREIDTEYSALIDELRGRVRAHITLARDSDPELQDEIVTALEKRLGKTVVPHFTSDPTLVGGVLIRVGDQLYDGSLRRRISGLRRRLVLAG